MVAMGEHRVGAGYAGGPVVLITGTKPARVIRRSRGSRHLFRGPLVFRALFFLGGLFLLAQGGIALAISEITLHDWAVTRLADAGLRVRSSVVLPVWLAPTLVATGGVTLVYAIALPAKEKEKS